MEFDYEYNYRRRHDRYYEDYDRYERHERDDRGDRVDRRERHSKDSHRKHSKKKRSKHSKHSKKSKRKYSHKDKDKSVDKKALLQIAQENLAKMIEKGDLPKNTDISKLKLKHLREMSTQQSVTQWTELCRAISAMEAAAYSDLSSDFDSDSDSDYDTRSRVSHHSSKNDGHHPFQLKEHREIEIKVRDFVQLQPRNAKEVQKELREQFPVSSGFKHRVNDDEWVEVKPPSPKRTKKIKEKTVVTEVEKQLNNEEYLESLCSSNPSVDIGSVMAQRLNAMRRLQDDPCNVVALKQLFHSQEMMQDWVKSKTEPGQFTGGTGVNVLRPYELEGPSPAWTKKDQLLNAEPIKEGIGMHLLLKMGWKPGEGLGKNGEGNPEPIAPVLKFDTKGLVAESEVVKNLPMQLVTVPSEAVGKHPVSMLQEYCSRKKWIVPLYEMIQETGPDHKKNFLMKVLVNGVEYQPSMSCPNKKQAKALAATVCLQAFGLLPKDEKEPAAD